MIVTGWADRMTAGTILRLLMVPLWLVMLPPGAQAFIPRGLALLHATMSARRPDAYGTVGETKRRGSFYEDNNLSKQFAQMQQAAQMAWATKFEEVLVSQGQDIVLVGYDGYLRSGGKGVVVVFGDKKVGLDGYEMTFKSLDELLNNPVPGIKMSEEEKDDIASRVIGSDPEEEVAVLLACNGQVGLNVVKPAYPPKYLHNTFRGKR